MNSIFIICNLGIPLNKINMIKGFNIHYSNYFRFFKKLTNSNIFTNIYNDLVKYKFDKLQDYNKVFSIDSTII
jgi:hypothetical protein